MAMTVMTCPEQIYMDQEHHFWYRNPILDCYHISQELLLVFTNRAHASCCLHCRHLPYHWACASVLILVAAARADSCHAKQVATSLLSRMMIAQQRHSPIRSLSPAEVSASGQEECASASSPSLSLYSKSMKEPLAVLQHLMVVVAQDCAEEDGHSAADEHCCELL